MIKINNLKLPFDHGDDQITREAARKLDIDDSRILKLEIMRSSLDARANRPLSRVYTVVVELKDESLLDKRVRGDRDLTYSELRNYHMPSVLLKKDQGRPLIVGTGPAGLFAGLILAEAGINPILIERGKPAGQRVKDVELFWEKGVLNQESNVQFGEGGAGTFSDGKLTTRVTDKHCRSEKILQELVAAGAPPEILVHNKPHVGTANLVRVVENLREKIERLGGSYRFESRVDDLILEGNHIRGVELDSGERLLSSPVILAVGHSARDTFSMLRDRGVQLAAKPFSVGFRIEHAQSFIDQAQYGKHAGHPALGAADYQLSFRTSQGRAAYSFCMCPGGYVIGAASEHNGLVTNGMSQHARNGQNGNSAIVAEVYPADFSDQPLAGFAFQRSWEENAFILGGGDYFAPAQLVADFLQGRKSTRWGAVQPTYQPGVRSVDLDQALPGYITAAIREALVEFNRRMPGFAGPDALITGVETRTSCPLRILREKDGQSVSLKGLYPVGEGSGYAGGIMSSAIDGIKAAEKVILALNQG